MAVDHGPRVFLDANILVHGVTFPRFPYEVLRHGARLDFRPVLCLNHELVPATPSEQVLVHPHLMRDPGDVPVALAAINARVDYLISTDRDFIDRDDSTAELRLNRWSAAFQRWPRAS